MAFKALKRSLVTAPVLHMPDFELPFVLTTDASAVSVGGILEQDFGAGLQPVAYESKKLSPAEIRYSAYERDVGGSQVAFKRVDNSQHRWPCDAGARSTSVDDRPICGYGRALRRCPCAAARA